MWIRCKLEKIGTDYYLRRYNSKSYNLRLTVHTSGRKYLDHGIIVLYVSSQGIIRPIRRSAQKIVDRDFFTRFMIRNSVSKNEKRVIKILKTEKTFDSKLELIWECSVYKSCTDLKSPDSYYNKIYKSIKKYICLQGNIQ